MHCSTHVYYKNTEKKDYFKYGGSSEFCGHSLEIQMSRIESGLKKFRDEKIKIRSFFAPNSTYDKNTFAALKNLGKDFMDDLFPNYQKAKWRLLNQIHRISVE